MTNLFTLLLFIVFGFAQNNEPQIKIKVSGIASSKANLIVELYDNEDDFLEKPAFKKTFSVQGNNATIKLNDIPAGKYAVGVIHDENKNGKLDTYIFGIPKEPVGISNHEKLRGKPDFQKALVEINKDNNPTITIRLN